jgi:Spy/CpxP family protein refolding chaperone
MRPTIRHAALALIAAASIAAPAAHAQQQQDPRGPSAEMKARMQAMREGRERQRAQDLRTILRLRPDQEAALTAFLQSHKRPDGEPGAKPGDRRGPPAEAGMAMTTPQRLDEMAKRDAERDATQQRRAEALRTFYAALTPDQRPVFDALQRLQGRDHGGRGGLGFGGRGWRGPMGGLPPGGPSPRD